MDHSSSNQVRLPSKVAHFEVNRQFHNLSNFEPNLTGPFESQNSLERSQEEIKTPYLERDRPSSNQLRLSSKVAHFEANRQFHNLSESQTDLTNISLTEDELETLAENLRDLIASAAENHILRRKSCSKFKV